MWHPNATFYALHTITKWCCRAQCRALKEMATCMMESKELNPKIHDEDINCAAYVQNISPHKALDGRTPFEAWSGQKPNVSHFRVFGSKAWDRIPPNKRNALQPQINESLMVGYAEYSKGYKLFDPSYHKEFIERSL